MKFENFNIAGNNIINVKLATVLRYQIRKWEDLLKGDNFSWTELKNLLIYSSMFYFVNEVLKVISELQTCGEAACMWDAIYPPLSLSGTTTVHSSWTVVVVANPASFLCWRRSGDRTRHEHAVTSSELACCPLPAQVFSQQLPNQHAIFFSEF